MTRFGKVGLLTKAACKPRAQRVWARVRAAEPKSAQRLGVYLVWRLGVYLVWRGSWL
jgi:hypothetical protein